MEKDEARLFFKEEIAAGVSWANSVMLAGELIAEPQYGIIRCGQARIPRWSCLLRIESDIKKNRADGQKPWVSTIPIVAYGETAEKARDAVCFAGQPLSVTGRIAEFTGSARRYNLVQKGRLAETLHCRMDDPFCASVLSLLQMAPTSELRVEKYLSGIGDSPAPSWAAGTPLGTSFEVVAESFDVLPTVNYINQVKIAGMLEYDPDLPSVGQGQLQKAVFKVRVRLPDGKADTVRCVWHTNSKEDVFRLLKAGSFVSIDGSLEHVRYRIRVMDISQVERQKLAALLSVEEGSPQITQVIECLGLLPAEPGYRHVVQKTHEVWVRDIETGTARAIWSTLMDYKTGR